MSETPFGYDADIDVKAEADKMLLAMRFLADVDLDGICAVVRAAHTVGPFIDPTKYREALYRGDMDAIADLADQLRPAVRVFREQILPKVPA